MSYLCPAITSYNNQIENKLSKGLMEITPSLQLQSGYLETSASRHLNVIIMEKKL
jgi:hypothetical protein